MTQANDGLTSLISNMGNPGKDKAASTAYTSLRLTDDQLIAAYSSSWIARKLVNLPANDMLRKWRTWAGDNPAAIEAEEKRLKIRSKILECKIKSRLFGGAAIFIGTGQDLTQPLNINAIGKAGIKYLTVLDRRELTAGEIVTDPLSEYHNKPAYYTVAGTGVGNIHPSHFVVMHGNEGMDIAINDGWGVSILQSAMDAAKNADSTAGNIASLIFEANVDVIGIPDLTANLASGGKSYENDVKRRFALFAAGKGISGVGILDKDEEYNRKSVSFAQLPDLLEAFLMIAGATEGIPATRFMGSPPKGMSSTGEGDMKTYYDEIQSKQNNELMDEIDALDRALQQSAGAQGAYTWNPLQQMSEHEEAEIVKLTAEGLSIINDLGVFGSMEMREIAKQQLTALGINTDVLGDEFTGDIAE
jgi:phage-related protein (TIGR01555 family)